jgi:hypothetical protein
MLDQPDSRKGSDRPYTSDYLTQSRWLRTITSECSQPSPLVARLSGPSHVRNQPEAPSFNELVRRGERTVDNLKRLFAVVFALSFGIAGYGVFAKLKTAMLPTGSKG